MTPGDEQGDRLLARLRLGLRLYGALWASYFVFMGIDEVIEVVPRGGTLASLIRWGHGGDAVALMLVAINVVIGVALFRSARDPVRHRSAIDLGLAINVTHMATMAVLSVAEPHEHVHLLGDVPAGLLATVAVGALWLPVRDRAPIVTA